MSWYGTGRDFYRAGISIAFAIRSFDLFGRLIARESLSRLAIALLIQSVDPEP